MKEILTILELFRDGNINDNTLKKIKIFRELKANNIIPIEIRTEHVINILEKFLIEEIDSKQLLIWVNIIWFSGFFEYKSEDMDSISCVMNELEEIDEDESKISFYNIKRYLFALQNNIEI